MSEGMCWLLWLHHISIGFSCAIFSMGLLWGSEQELRASSFGGSLGFSSNHSFISTLLSDNNGPRATALFSY